MNQITIKQLLQETQQQDTAAKICYKGNQIVQRFNESSKEIIQSIIKNLTTFNEQAIKGYSSILINLLITYPDNFSVSFLFIQLQNQIQKMEKNDHFVGHVYARLICILTCFQSAIHSKQADPDKCVQLLATILKNKFKKFDNTSNLLIYSCLQEIKHLINIQQFVAEYFRSFLGVSILLEDKKQWIDTSLLYDALTESQFYSDNSFSKHLCEYLSTRRNQLIEILDEIQKNVEKSGKEQNGIHHNHFVEFYNEVMQMYPENDIQKKIIQSVRNDLILLLREQNSVSAQQREPIIRLLTNVLSIQLDEQFVSEMIEAIIVQDQFTFYLTKTFDKLCQVCNDEQRVKLLEHIIKQQNTLLGTERTLMTSYLSPILTILKHSKELSKAMLEQIINQIIDHTHVTLCKNNHQLISVQLNLNQTAKQQFKKHIIPIALTCQDGYQIIKDIASQIMMQNCNPSDIVYIIGAQLEELNQLFTQNQQNQPTNEQTNQLFSDNTYIVGNMINFLYEYILYCVLFREFQLAIQTAYNIIIILIRMQQLLHKSEVDYNIHQDQLFAFVAEFLQKMARIRESKDFSLQILKKFANIVPDDFIGQIVVGLDLFANDEESAEEGEEFSEYEDDGSSIITNPSNDKETLVSQTDLFKFDHQDALLSVNEYEEEEGYEYSYSENQQDGHLEKHENNDQNEINESSSFISDELEQKDIEINMLIANRVVKYLQLLFEYNEGRGLLWDVMLEIVQIMQKVIQDSVEMQYNKGNNVERQIQDFVKQALELISRQNIKNLDISWFDLQNQQSDLVNILKQLYETITSTNVQKIIKEKCTFLYQTILYKIIDLGQFDQIVIDQFNKIISQCHTNKIILQLLRDLCQAGGKLQCLLFQRIEEYISTQDSAVQWQIIQKLCNVILQLTNIDPIMQKQIQEFMIGLLECFFNGNTDIQMQKKCVYEILPILKKYKIKDASIMERVEKLRQRQLDEQIAVLLDKINVGK